MKQGTNFCLFIIAISIANILKIEIQLDFCKLRAIVCLIISDPWVGLVDQYISIWENLQQLDRINMPMKHFSNTMLSEVAKHFAESPQQ